MIKMGNEMKIGNIYYIIPDIFSPEFRLIDFLRSVKHKKWKSYIDTWRHGAHRPIGGIKVNYQHCIQLQEAGFKAYPLVMGKFDGNFFYQDIETKHIDDIGYELNENDVVVSTEFLPYDGLDFENCMKILFIQNQVNILRRKKTEDRYASYRSLGYDHVISCGDYITEVVKSYHNEDCVTLNNGVDHTIFFPDSSMRKENRIMCLPRKHPEDIKIIQSIVKTRCPQANFVHIDGVTEAEIAVEYRKSDIFLATGYPEGFALPPMEAIFSGAVVVGFAGQGGREFLKDGETALIAEDGDCVNAAKKMISLLEDQALKERIRQNSTSVIASHNIDKMKEKVINYFNELNDSL